MNKGTLAKNVAKVEAKEKELAEAKAKAKVRCHSFVSALPVPPLRPHPSLLCARAGVGSSVDGVSGWQRGVGGNDSHGTERGQAAGVSCICVSVCVSVWESRDGCIPV
ncbi:MAG: hypothetical protein ACPIOQ_76625 [Promethearchaeia archaeon]